MWSAGLLPSGHAISGLWPLIVIPFAAPTLGHIAPVELPLGYPNRVVDCEIDLPIQATTFTQFNWRPTGDLVLSLGDLCFQYCPIWMAKGLPVTRPEY